MSTTIEQRERELRTFIDWLGADMPADEDPLVYMHAAHASLTASFHTDMLRMREESRVRLDSIRYALWVIAVSTALIALTVML